MADRRGLLGQRSSDEEEEDRFFTPPEGRPRAPPPSAGTRPSQRTAAPSALGTPMPGTEVRSEGGTIRYGPAAARLFQPSSRRQLFGQTSPAAEGYQPLESEPSTSGQQTEPSVRPKVRPPPPARTSSLPSESSTSPRWMPWKPPKDRAEEEALLEKGHRHKASSPEKSDSESESESLGIINRGFVMPGARARADSVVPENFPRFSGTASPGGSSLSSTVSERTPSPGSRARFHRTSPPRPGSVRDRPRAKPIPPFYGTPTPPNVRKYRTRTTGSPDFDLMRNDTKKSQFFQTPEAIGFDLANRSQRNLNQIYDWPRKRRGRKAKLLQKRFSYIGNFGGTKRYGDPSLYDDSDTTSDSSMSSGSERRHLIPRRERDEKALMNPAFYRPLPEMGSRYRSDVQPVGRLGFGRLDGYYGRSRSVDDLHFMNRHDIVDRPENWSDRERAFAQRLGGLSRSDFELYKSSRDQVDPALLHDKDAFPIADRLGRAPTGTNLMDLNKKHLKLMKEQSQSARNVMPSDARDQRRRRASLPLLLPSQLSQSLNIQPPLESQVPKESKEDRRRKRKQRVQRLKDSVDKCVIQ